MITRVFIQASGNGQLEPEHRDLFDEFVARGYDVILFTEKLLTRRRVRIDRTSLVVGYVPVVLGALKQLDVPSPAPDDYPECLRGFLRRRIWESRLDAVRKRVYREDFQPFFIKPKDQLKRFTGRVIESAYDLSWLDGISKQAAVYCAEVVQWRTESRVFVINGSIKGVRNYSGDPSVLIDEATAKAAVDTLEESGKASSAYGIDFGVLSSGETALIELNDGFSLGSYGLDRSVYADLILKRWTELVLSSQSIAAPPS
jgi:hypothetical protein